MSIGKNKGTIGKVEKSLQTVRTVAQKQTQVTSQSTPIDKFSSPPQSRHQTAVAEP